MIKSDTTIIHEEEEYSHIPEIGNDEDEIKQSRTKISEFLLKIEEKSKEKTNGNRPNPYFCPHFGTRLLKLSKYFTLWTAVMTNEKNPDAKNVPLVPTSAHSEEYFKELKCQVLKGEKSIRVVKFVIIHLRSLGGTIKLLHALCQPDTHGRKLPDNENIMDGINKSVNSDVSKDADNTDCLRLSSIDDEILPKKEASVAEEQMPPIEETIKVETNDYLNKVETWKGLNKTSTKRGKYLTPCADIENMHKRPRIQTKLPLLINGNSLPPVKTREGILKVKNTCPFDSALQCIITAYNDWASYNDYLNETSHVVYNFVKEVSQSNVNNKTYSTRANLLLQFLIPSNGQLNAHMNVSAMILKLLHDVPSLTWEKNCKDCNYKKIRVDPMISIDLQPICTEGIKGLQKAIREHFTDRNAKKCFNCKSNNYIQTFKASNHVFIDIEGLEYSNVWKNVDINEPHKTTLTLAEIPTDVEIQNETYKLVGIISYIPGHYQCYVRRINGKWELHDGISVTKEPIRVTARALLEKRRIHVLFYVKITN